VTENEHIGLNLGAIQKICHTILDQIWPPPLCHKLSHMG